MSGVTISNSLKTRRSRVIAVALAAGVAACSGAYFLLHPDPRALLQKGMAIGLRDRCAGDRLLRRSIEAAGGSYPDAEIALSLSQASADDWEAALRQFSAIDKRACRADLLIAFARAALRTGHTPEALESLETVRARSSQESIAALELLMSYYDEWGMKAELIAAARELSHLEPDNPQPWSLLVDLLKSEVRRDAECLSAIRGALHCDLPEASRREFQHKLFEQLIICGDAVGARRELSRLKETEGETFRLCADEVDLCRLEGNPDEALAIMNRLVPEARDKAQAFLIRGIVNLDLGRYEDAARDLTRTVSAAPHNAAAQFKLSEAYRRLGHDDLARHHRELASTIAEKHSRIDELCQRLGRDPGQREIYGELTKLYRALGEDEAADQWERRALMLTR
jgi:tetratricopeptide (TPR) repeat protein